MLSVILLLKNKAFKAVIIGLFVLLQFEEIISTFIEVLF